MRGAEPRYGTIWISVPVVLANRMAARCDAPPTPVVPTMPLPGLALSQAVSSVMFVAGTDLAATASCGPSAISATGSRSVSRSNGSV